MPKQQWMVRRKIVTCMECPCEIQRRIGMVFISGERFGSGDGERKTLLTRQIAFEPLPASVLFALVGSCGVVMSV